MQFKALKQEAEANRTKPENVLVVYDSSSQAATNVANYYAQVRGLAAAQLFGFDLAAGLPTSGIVHRQPSASDARAFIDQVFEFVTIRRGQGWRFSAAFFIGEWPYRLPGASNESSWISLCLFGLSHFYQSGKIDDQFDGNSSTGGQDEIRISPGAFQDKATAYLDIDAHAAHIMRYGQDVKTVTSGSLTVSPGELSLAPGDSSGYFVSTANGHSLVTTFLPLGEGPYRSAADAETFGRAYIDRVIAGEGRADWGEVLLVDSNYPGHISAFLAEARLWGYPLDNVYWALLGEALPEHIIGDLPGTKNPAGFNISARTNSTGWETKYPRSVFFHVLGANAYYSDKTEPYTADWIDYESGALVLVAQSYGAGHTDPLDFPDWDYLIDPDDQAESLAGTLVPYDSGRLLPYRIQSSEPGARFSVSSGVIRIQDDNGADVSIDVSGLSILEGFRAIVSAIPPTWTARFDDARTIGRAFDALKNGAAFAAGAIYEPLSNNDIESSSFFNFLSLGATIADAIRNYRHVKRNRDHVYFGDPLYRPFPGGLAHVTDQAIDDNEISLGPVYSRTSPTTIDTKGAAYSINGGPWLFSPSEIESGQSLTIKKSKPKALAGFGLNQFIFSELQIMSLKTYLVANIVEISTGALFAAGFELNQSAYYPNNDGPTPNPGQLVSSGFGCPIVGISISSLFGNLSGSITLSVNTSLPGVYSKGSGYPFKAVRLFDTDNLEDVIAGGEAMLFELFPSEIVGSIDRAYNFGDYNDSIDAPGPEDLATLAYRRLAFSQASTAADIALPVGGNTYIVEVELSEEYFADQFVFSELPSLPTDAVFQTEKLSVSPASVKTYAGRANEFSVAVKYGGMPVDLSVFDRFVLIGLTASPIDTDINSGVIRAEGSNLVFDIGPLVSSPGENAVRVIGYNATDLTAGVVLIDSATAKSKLSVNVLA